MKTKDKICQDAEHRAEMKKDLQIQMAIMMQKMQENMAKNWKNIVPLGGTSCTHGSNCGKKEVIYEIEEGSEYDDSGGGSETSSTQEIDERTRKLCLSEKRKRGPEPFSEDSPLLERTSKWTPTRGALKPVKLTRRMMQAKAKSMKTRGSTKRRSSIKTQLSNLKKTPPKKKSLANLTPSSEGALTRLRYMNAAMKELKNLDATELQRICKEEGINYDKKVDALFDIAEHHTVRMFETEVMQEAEVLHISESADHGNTTKQHATADE
ncbi:hypothetical protein CBR_g39087 [Chara braunii]|uniref:Uncharacterized protein n=1 Tax=Chara braunii TaxID=69332 RepID=A0A388LR18_CHABU|nr:hypothetical protein CBR_g39087 [Chara braunii]|eukprot:GBG84711.1 hypothetical protein CBR_g39087 [Chara braunii]